MPRIRSIKPDFFKSASIARLTYRSRLTFQGLWCLADDQGRLRDDARVIAGELWPQEDDVTWREVEEDLAALGALEFINRYAVDDVGYLQVGNWHVHQKINKATASKYPAPPGAGTEEETLLRESSGSGVSTGATVENVGTESYLEEGEGEREKEKEREGEPPHPETPPSPRCDAHQNHVTPGPCWACRDARMRRQDWDRAERLKPTPRIERDPECPVHPGYPRNNLRVGIQCPRCAEDES